MKTTVGFFYEKPGVKSSMRLMSFLALFFSALLSAYAIYTKQLDMNVLFLITTFIVAAFAPKAVQKYAERESIKPE